PKSSFVICVPVSLELHEWIEDATQVVLGDSAAGIGDADVRRAAVVSRVGDAAFHEDSATRIGELVGVREEIEQDLLNLFRVAEHAKRRFALGYFAGDALGLHLRSDER